MIWRFLKRDRKWSNKKSLKKTEAVAPLLNILEVKLLEALRDKRVGHVQSGVSLGITLNLNVNVEFRISKLYFEMLRHIVKSIKPKQFWIAIMLGSSMTGPLVLIFRRPQNHDSQR